MEASFLLMLLAIHITYINLSKSQTVCSLGIRVEQKHTVDETTSKSFKLQLRGARNKQRYR